MNGEEKNMKKTDNNEQLNIELYKPDFSAEKWTKEDRYYLEPFATNIDGFVSVLRNLPPEIVGALCSRASRAQGSLLKILLNEYIYPILKGNDKNLSKELKTTVDFLKKHGFKNILNNQRAQAFYAKWLSQFGDDSIAQLTGTHIIFWGISQVAIKYIEDQRIGLEPLEKSTRYVNYGEKINGKYLYYIPYPDLERLKLLEQYKKTIDCLFDTYKELIPILVDWLKKHYNEKESVLEKKAFDSLRGLLPMATLSQLAIRGNAQSFEYLINRTAKYPLGEMQWISKNLHQELKEEIPSLLLRLDDKPSKEYQSYLKERRENIRKKINGLRKKGALDFLTIGKKPEVKLIEYDSFAENKIIAALLFSAPECHLAWNKILKFVKNTDIKEKLEILNLHFKGRTKRFEKVGREFENSFVRFEILIDIGAYRDLHRHRMLTQERQLFSCYHGYDVPDLIKEAGIADRYIEALEKAKILFLAISGKDPYLAEYAVPMAYRIRFYQYTNLRQLFWEIELRTISQGHPNYRHIEQEKFRLLKEKFPLISRFIKVDMNDYDLPRRGAEEETAKKEKNILEKLAVKNK